MNFVVWGKIVQSSAVGIDCWLVFARAFRQFFYRFYEWMNRRCTIIGEFYCEGVGGIRRTHRKKEKKWVYTISLLALESSQRSITGSVGWLAVAGCGWLVGWHVWHRSGPVRRHWLRISGASATRVSRCVHFLKHGTNYDYDGGTTWRKRIVIYGCVVE